MIPQGPYVVFQACFPCAHCANTIRVSATSFLSNQSINARAALYSSPICAALLSWRGCVGWGCCCCCCGASITTGASSGLGIVDPGAWSEPGRGAFDASSYTGGGTWIGPGCWSWTIDLSLIILAWVRDAFQGQVWRIAFFISSTLTIFIQLCKVRGCDPRAGPWSLYNSRCYISMQFFWSKLRSERYLHHITPLGGYIVINT